MNAPAKINPAQNVAAALRPNGGQVARSDATAIEQSRAVAEVQAMVVVAQHARRNEGRARMAIQAACGEIELANRAFFKYSRGGGTISGPSIHLATELGRCWGNIDYGIHELRRDDDKAESEMMAYAWDLETNARARTTFIVPHKRDKRGGGEILTDMRDIYENNANMGARRLREMIFRVVPSYLVEEAKALCMKTLADADGGGTNPGERKKAMMAAFEAIGISTARLEAKLGSKAALWTPLDMAGLRVSYGSVTRGEISADEEFPQVTSAAVTDALTPKPQQEQQTQQSAGEEGATTAADAPGEADSDASQPTSPGGTDAGEAREWHATGASNDALLASLLQMVGEARMAADLADIRNTNAAVLAKWASGAANSAYRRNLTAFDAAVKARSDKLMEE